MPSPDTPPSGLRKAAERPDGQRGFLSQSLASVCIKGASLLLGFATVVVLARVLGKEAYGVYAVVFATISVLSIPAALGTPSLVVRETARARADDAPEMIRPLWARADYFVLAASSVILLLAGLWLGFGGLEQDWVWAMLAGLALVPLRAFIAVRGAMLRGMGQIVTGQLPEFVLRPGLFLVLVVLLAWMSGPEPPGAPETLIVHGFAATFALAIAMLLLVRSAPSAGARGTSSMGPAEMLIASGTMGLIAGAQVLNNNLDVMMLGALAERGDAGVYKVAASCAMLAGFGLQAVNQALMPRIAASHKRGDRATMQVLVRQSARLSLLLAVLSAVVLGSVGMWFLEAAFGSGFEAGYHALLILLAGQVLNATFGPVISVLNMTGHERETLIGVLIACAVNVVLNAVLIPLYGIEGAAGATAITLVCWNALLWLKVRQRLGLNPTAFATVPK